jgi:hypothetical protein
MAAAACPAGLSGTLVLYIVAQFVTWAVHDGLQQYMFEQPGFERFGVTMALCLQARQGCCVAQGVGATGLLCTCLCLVLR